MKRLVAYLAAYSSIVFAASPLALANAQPDTDARVKSLHLNEIAMRTVENHFLRMETKIADAVNRGIFQRKSDRRTERSFRHVV